MPVTQTPRTRQGFALIVIAALFVAFSLLAGAILDRSLLAQGYERDAATRRQLTRLSNALLEYASRNSGRYPCPARLDLILTDTNFGSSIANCQTGAPAGLVILSGGTDMVLGMVPARTLAAYGLDLNDAVDPWGVKISYVVNRQGTPGGSGGLSAHIFLSEYNIGVTYREPDFLLMSSGRDMMGGIGKWRTTAAVSCAGAVIPRRANCNDDLYFIQAPALSSSNSSANRYFDDILSFYTHG